MTRPRKSAPDVVARAQRILAEQDERRRQVAAGGEPSRRGHRSGPADDGGDAPDDNHQHTEE